jgi:hypothetical protein
MAKAVYTNAIQAVGPDAAVIVNAGLNAQFSAAV